MTITVQDITPAEQRKLDERAALIDGLRQVADFLTEHPEVPRPYHLMGTEYFIYLYGDDQRAQLVTIARAMGRSEKRIKGERYQVRRQFAGLTLVAQADRDEVCEKVVTGSTEVTREVPDPELLATVPKVSVTEVVETVEWRCTPLLADREPAEVQA
jgi:hypothetical protein